MWLKSANSSPCKNLLLQQLFIGGAHAEQCSMFVQVIRIPNIVRLYRQWKILVIITGRKSVTPIDAVVTNL